MQTKGPAGPSQPLQQVYNQLPFVNAPIISTVRNTKMSRGMIVPIPSLAANTSLVIKHNLGRLMQGAIGIANGSGTYPPRVAMVTAGTPVRTQAQQTIQCDTACTNALIWVF